MASPTSPHGPRQGHHQQPLSQHINRPLRRHEWVSRRRPWDRGALDRERTDYFDTRVTGRPEIWQTLHAALGVLWAADIRTRQGVPSSASTGDEDPAVALATAQGILTAADITLPSGDLAQGAYDQFGNYYALPEWVVADPANLGQEARPALGDAKGDLAAGETSADDGDAADGDEAERRREEKGKAVVKPREQIAVRARLSENSHDVTISLSRDETVRSLIRRISEEARVGSPLCSPYPPVVLSPSRTLR